MKKVENIGRRFCTCKVGPSNYYSTRGNNCLNTVKTSWAKVVLPNRNSSYRLIMRLVVNLNFSLPFLAFIWPL